MSDRHGILQTLRSALVPIHPAGYPFVGLGVVATVAGLAGYAPLGWVLLLVTAWIVYFFRDPDRVTPVRPGLVIAAADGVVSKVEAVVPPAELALGSEERVRISTFLSIFDVHVNRAPVPGTIVRTFYVAGAFVNAASDKASELNERRGLVIESPEGTEVAVVQIAGLVARRIVVLAAEGDALEPGERFGLIRFGSRVDVYLPVGATSLIAEGQRTIAGETVLADLGSDEPARAVRHG